jgi:hypothetical protein
MDDVKKQFMDVLYGKLIPRFCSRSDRKMTPKGFCPDNLKNLHEKDMADFLRGWKEEIFKDVRGGLYKAPRGGSKEQFFWSGLTANSPRTFSLWLEPIIALGVLARMHLDFKWPRELIGSQTKRRFAFDVFGCKSPEPDETVLLACEIKKSPEEIDALITHMHEFGLKPALTEESLPKAAAKNAFKKVKELRANKAGTFWAVGPGRYQKVFSVKYRREDVVEFVPAPKPEEALVYRKSVCRGA